MTSSPAAFPKPLVDQLNAASLIDLAIDAGNRQNARRAYALPTRLELSTAFPDMEIGELLGTGGMGCVFKARQKRLERVVALKILPKELAKDQLFAERFAREARAMARLSHPNVVRVYDFGNAGDVCYLIMEYMDGMNLRELLDAGKLNPNEAVLIFEQVSQALAYAHQEGVVHRDIKPENILFSRTGHVSLADFGLARLAMDSGCEVSLTQTRQAMGTLNYMAPEQWDNPKAVDHRADVYAMGILLYELLTGRVPRGSFPPASVLTGAPNEIDGVINRSLQVEPAARFQSIAEMNDALRNAVNGVAMGGMPVDTPIDINGAGTFTRVLHVGERFARSLQLPVGAKASDTVKRIRWDSHQWICLVALVLIAMGSVAPWCFYEGRYTTGLETSVMFNGVEIPNDLVLVSAIVTFLATLLRAKLNPLRSALISLTASSLSFVHLMALLSGEGRMVLSSFDGAAENQGNVHFTVIPYLIIVCFGLVAIEQTIQLILCLLEPVNIWVVQPAVQAIRDHNAEQKRKNQEWMNRWKAGFHGMWNWLSNLDWSGEEDEKKDKQKDDAKREATAKKGETARTAPEPP